MRKLILIAAKSSAGTFINLISSAIAIKIIALFSGPAGVGLFSLLRQTQQTAAIVGSIGGQAAIVQSLSDKNEDERLAHISVISRSVLLVTSLVCLVLILASSWLGRWIFGDLDNAALLIKWIAVPVFFASGSLLFSGIINSYRAIGLLSLVQIATGISLAVFAWLMRQSTSGPGYLVLLSVSSCTGFVCALYFCWKRQWLVLLSEGMRQINRSAVSREFIKVGLATLIVGLIGTGSVLIVRSIIAKFDGYAVAGIFDAAWTLSMTYVMLILSSFSAYYLPTLGMLKDNAIERNKLIEQYFRFATYASFPLILFVMLFKPWIVVILYSKEFTPAIHVMRWMLLGDYFKISSWVMAMPMLAYADLKPYVISELLWNVGLSVSAYVAFSLHADIEMIGVIFMTLYAGYFLYTYLYCKKKFNINIPGNLFFIWMAGFCSLLGLSYITNL